MQKTIYKSEEGKQKILELYDRQLKRLNVPYRDLYVETSFGRTHLIETGSPEGEPLLVFHGGNATTAYNLLTCDFLFMDFHIYAVDTIGHPGKSAETSLSAFSYDYGKWVGEVIDALGYEQISLFGGSFGGGIIAKAMCTVPEKIKRALLAIIREHQFTEYRAFMDYVDLNLSDNEFDVASNHTFFFDKYLTSSRHSSAPAEEAASVDTATLAEQAMKESKKDEE